MTGCCWPRQRDPPAGHPRLAQHAIGLKTGHRGLYLRDHILGRLETADDLTDPGARRAALTFIVVGAGYAGVSSPPRWPA